MNQPKFIDTITSFCRKHSRLSIGVAIAAIFAIFTLGIVAAHRTHNYTSDDVAQQNVLLNSGKYGHQEAWIGVDNFVIKLPFYQLVNSTLGQSRTALLVTIVFFNTVAFIGLIATFWIIWRGKLREMVKNKKLLIPVMLGLTGFLWVASLGNDLAVSFVNPNVRNAEVGICIFLAVLALYWAQRKTAPLWGTALISLVTGVLIYSDPYFLYTLFIPLAAVPLYYYFFDKKNVGSINVLRLYILIAASFAVYKLADLFTGALGFNVYHPDVMFANITTIGSNIQNVISSFLYIFNGNFFGRVANGESLIIAMNAALAIVFVSLTIVYLIRRRFTSPYAVLFGITVIATIALYGISTNSDSMYTVRYLVLVPYAVLFLIPFVLQNVENTRLKAAFVGIMLLASVGNALATVQMARTKLDLPSDQLGNTQNYQVLGALDTRGLEKGYGDYWDGNIHTYLSSGKHMTIPVVCNGEKRLQIYYWLMDAAWLNKTADRTYLIYDNAKDIFTRCSKEAIAEQFGEPKEVMRIDAQRELMVFDYDIYERMPQRTTTENP